MRTTEWLIGEFEIRKHAPLNKIGQVKKWLSYQLIICDRRHKDCVLSRTRVKPWSCKLMNFLPTFHELITTKPLVVGLQALCRVATSRLYWRYKPLVVPLQTFCSGSTNGSVLPISMSAAVQRHNNTQTKAFLTGNAMHSRASRCLVMVYLNDLQFLIFNHAKAFKLQCTKHPEI